MPDRNWLAFVMLPSFPFASRAFISPSYHVLTGTWIVYWGWPGAAAAHVGQVVDRLAGRPETESVPG